VAAVTLTPEDLEPFATIELAKAEAMIGDALALAAQVAPCIVEAEFHFGNVHDLKAKRKLLKSLKDQLRGRFGAAVAETEGHDKWQRSVIVCALVGGSDVGDRGDGVERFIDSRFPDSVSFRRDLVSLEDIRE